MQMAVITEREWLANLESSRGAGVHAIGARSRAQTALSSIIGAGDSDSFTSDIDNVLELSLPDKENFPPWDEAFGGANSVALGSANTSDEDGERYVQRSPGEMRACVESDEAAAGYEEGPCGYAAVDGDIEESIEMLSALRCARIEVPDDDDELEQADEELQQSNAAHKEQWFNHSNSGSIHEDEDESLNCGGGGAFSSLPLDLSPIRPHQLRQQYNDHDDDGDGEEEELHGDSAGLDVLCGAFSSAVDLGTTASGVHPAVCSSQMLHCLHSPRSPPRGGGGGGNNNALMGSDHNISSVSSHPYDDFDGGAPAPVSACDRLAYITGSPVVTPVRASANSSRNDASALSGLLEDEVALSIDGGDGLARTLFSAHALGISEEPFNSIAAGSAGGGISRHVAPMTPPTNSSAIAAAVVGNETSSGTDAGGLQPPNRHAEDVWTLSPLLSPFSSLPQHLGPTPQQLRRAKSAKCSSKLQFLDPEHAEDGAPADHESAGSENVSSSRGLPPKHGGAVPSTSVCRQLHELLEEGED